MKRLPAYLDAAGKEDRREKRTALEQFILDNEPAGGHDEKIFRVGLAAVVSELTGEDCDPNLFSPEEPTA